MQTRRSTPRTISINDTRKQLKERVQDVAISGDAVIVDSGKEQVVIISVEDFQAFVALDERERREEAMRRYRALEQKASDENQTLTNEEIEDLSVYIGREINERINQRYRASLLDQPQIDSE